MKTYFALHCITRRNVDDPIYDEELEKLGYDEAPLPDSQIPTKIDIAQGQIDEPLIEKGKFQALRLGREFKKFDLPLRKIICAEQIRCKETADIIAKELGIPVEVDKRLDARSYGDIAEKAMETDKLKHFWKYGLNKEVLETVLSYLLAPERIHAEKKSDFKARVNEFIQEKGTDLDNVLIVAGSDVWKLIQKENYFYGYTNEKTSDLKRGQPAFIDFEREKEPKFLKGKSQERTQ